MDARNYLETLVRDKRAGKSVPSFDFIFADAVNDYSVPFHLTTRQFTEKVEQLLTPQGLYLVTIIDQFREGRFLGALVNTFETCFEYVYVFSCSTTGAPSGVERDTFVIACANRELDLDNLKLDQDPSKPFPYQQLTAEQLNVLAKRSQGLVLTDDYAPVENLLSRVAETAAPEIYAVLLQKADELTKQGQIAAAIEKYREALESKPEGFSCLINLGILLQQTQRIDEAISLFERARDLQPEHRIPYYNLAIAQLQRGHPDEALALFQKAVAVAPDYAEAHAQLGNLFFRRKDPAQAAEHYRKSLETHADDPAVLNNLAATLVQLDQPEAALAHYEKALKLKPDYANCLVNLGNLHKLQGRIQAAKSSYEKALAIEPDSPKIKKLLRQLTADQPQ